MNVIATNIRFPKDEYNDLKLLALAEGRSVASIVREATSLYRKGKLGVKRKVSLLMKMRRAAVKSKVTVLGLIGEGRKFE